MGGDYCIDALSDASRQLLFAVGSKRYAIEGDYSPASAVA
jgi:hypothetical protein